MKSASRADSPVWVPAVLRRGPVLLVDSDAAVRRVVGLVLEGAGFACVTSANAAEARRLNNQYRPKLLLVEAQLEDETGQDLARDLALGDGWRPRIALMSAYPRDGRGSEDYFFKKPLEFDRLLQLLESIDSEPDR